MSKKYMKRGILSAALAVATMGSGSAFAVGLPVIDAANLVVNEINKWANITDLFVDAAILEEIKKLKPEQVLDHTVNIDNSTTNIDKTTQNIYDVTNKTYDITKNIDSSITEIKNYEKKNYDITKTFNNITNNYYGVGDGGEIPTSLKDSLSDQIKNASIYNNAATYVQGGVANPENLTEIDIKASANQKSANDALVTALSAHGDSLGKQMDGIKQLAEEGVKIEGHGNQLAYANALAGAQAVQLIELREMMLAAENARAAKVQADADTKSRQIAAAKTLREGLADGIGALSISSDISQAPASKGNL
jgi:hypothetical protein